jgi:hypothetical protein
MNDDVTWFLGLMIAFGLLWYAGGGLNKPSSKQPFIEGKVNGQTYGTDPFSKITSSSTANKPSTKVKNTPTPQSNEQMQTALQNAKLEADRIQNDITKLQEDKISSPLYGKITLSRPTNPGIRTKGTIIIKEYIQITASPNNTSPVLLTGMKLKSLLTANNAIIGKGVELPQLGIINTETPIFLPPGGVAYIYTGYSPNSMSFQINSCTGYLEQYQEFTPALPSNCPRPIDEIRPKDTYGFDGACLDYLRNLSQCRIVTEPPISLTYECKTFTLNTFNYPKCVANHKNEVNFYKSEWRIFLANTQPLWKDKYETIRLLDQDGKTIDTISY